MVGVEMADAWSSLGSEVTVIEALDRLLSREEPFAGEKVAEALQQAGVTIRTGSRAVAVEQTGQQITVELENGERFTGDRLLVAIGRKPHTDDLGLESVGLEPGQEIDVDDHLRVPGVDWLYVIGDANGRSLLTHSGKYQGRIAADHILGRPARATTDVAGAPRVTFTDPNVAAVGLTLEEASQKGIPAHAVHRPGGRSAHPLRGGHGAGRTGRGDVRRSGDGRLSAGGDDRGRGRGSAPGHRPRRGPVSDSQRDMAEVRRGLRVRPGHQPPRLMTDLGPAVRTVIRQCLAVSPGEDVVVVIDPATTAIGQVLRAEAAEAGADAVLVLMDERPNDGAEPPDTVAGALRGSQVFIAPTTRSLSHTSARKAATDAGARGATISWLTARGSWRSC